MKVIFEFDTDKENFDHCELERVKNADKMAHVLYEITNQIRSWYKYDDRESIPVDEIHEKIWDIINSEINLDNLYA